MLSWIFALNNQSKENDLACVQLSREQVQLLVQPLYSPSLYASSETVTSILLHASC